MVMSIRTFKRFIQFPLRALGYIGYIMETTTVKNYNIFILGFAFMLVFTGFNTMSGIQAMIFKSATTPGSGGYVEGFKGDGFIRKERTPYETDNTCGLAQEGDGLTEKP
eukprot:GFUD01140093.1.p1 GENE.GFUD01140093.1~~GFUD01140093.1.p1  ORF type:complete len:109 (+),score=24.99 GFUD01140093.1:139-465(+)